MATIREVSPAPWRMALLPASFAGVEYHVEQQARNSGRRIVVHEYPKRDDPYSEDMGKHAIRYQVTGYLVSPDYHIQKRRLIRALESEAGGTLVDPYFRQPIKCVCDRYSVTENRQRGGYCTFEMSFVEAGNPGNTAGQQDTGSAANAQAEDTGKIAADNANLTTDEAQRTANPGFGSAIPSTGLD